MLPRLRSTSAPLAAFALSFALYAASVRGDVSLWDTGDLQTVPYILGIPYPTGFPGFVLIGWLWSHLLPLGAVAWRMNLLAATATALTVAAVVAALGVVGIESLVALGAGAIFAGAATIWEHATYVDVHPVSFAAVAFALVFALRWERDGRLNDAAIALGAATLGLAIDNTTILMLPGLVLVAAARRPPARAILRGVACALVALLCVYAYLPIRSAIVTAERRDPTLALGIPPGRPYWDDGHPSTPQGFVRVVTGTRFAPLGALPHMVGVTAVRRIATDLFPLVRRELGDAVLWLALAGAALWWWRAPRVFGGLLAFGFVPLLWVYAYPYEADASRYYFAIFVLLVALAAYAASALHALPRPPRAAFALAGVFVVVAALVADEGASAHLLTQPYDPGSSPFVSRVKAVTRDGAVIVAPWLYATALAYGAYVEQRLDGRIVVTADAHEYQRLYRPWLRSHQVVVVSDDDERFPGFTLHELDRGTPHLYALR
jgi:hypothetical protein